MNNSSITGTQWKVTILLGSPLNDTQLIGTTFIFFPPVIVICKIQLYKCASMAAPCSDRFCKFLSGGHHGSALSELHRYWEESWFPEIRIHCFGGKSGQSFPALSRLALRYLGILASSVPAGRMLSKAGKVVSKKWSRLKGKTVNMLWMREICEWGRFWGNVERISGEPD